MFTTPNYNETECAIATMLLCCCCCFFVFIGYVSCGNPRHISNGQFLYTSESAGSYATLLCSHPFVATSNKLYRCSESGEWMGSGYCSKSKLNLCDI